MNEEGWLYAVCLFLSQISRGDDLPSVFAKQGLAKYTDLFLRHEIDLDTFATLTDDDLKEIGIQTFGARKKMKLLANSKCHSRPCCST